LEEFAVGIGSNCSERGGFHLNGLHGTLSFDNCGFRLRLRSPNAAAISFQREMVFFEPYRRSDGLDHSVEGELEFTPSTW
jgi:hypothetical protein